MEKMLALYRTPKDPEAFLAHYRDVHMPLVQALPGLVSANVTRISRTLVGEEGHYLLAELVFADMAALKTALKSPENAAVGADAMAFAGSLITVMTGSSVAF